MAYAEYEILPGGARAHTCHKNNIIIYAHRDGYHVHAE